MRRRSSGAAALLCFLLLACVLAPGVALARGDTMGRCEQEQRLAAARAAAAENRRILVTPERRVHILCGDARGGGHRPGLGIPGKSEFPKGWSDAKIIAAIEDVANDPTSARRVEPDGRTVVTGRRDGVAIRVVVERDGRSIVTGYPTNTSRNPPSQPR